VTSLIAVSAVWVAVGLATPDRTAADRLSRAYPRPRPARLEGAAARKRRACTVGAASAALLVATVVGGLAGVALGAGVGAATHRWLARLESAAERRRRAAVVEDLPLALDLIAGCLRAGLSMPASLRAAAGGTGPALSRWLLDPVERLALGAVPSEAWAGWAADPLLAPAARVLLRASTTGAQASGALRRLAIGERQRARDRAVAGAGTASVRALLPVTLCFLPAFVLLGVVPIALGLLRVLRG